MADLQKQHEEEMAALLKKKDQQLQEETAATLTGKEAKAPFARYFNMKLIIPFTFCRHVQWRYFCDGDKTDNKWC